MSYNALLTEHAVYWAPGQPDGYGGNQVDEPVEIFVRWQDKVTRSVDDQGVEYISQATIYCNQALAFEGWLWLGRLEDLESQEPIEINEAYKIRTTGRSQSSSGGIVVRKVML